MLPPIVLVPPPQTSSHPSSPTKPPAAAAVPPSTEPVDAAKVASTLQDLAKSVETIGKNLTVVTGDENIKMVLGGFISADFYYNHARPLSPGIPFFLTPKSPFGFDQNTYDANARATTLFALISGPRFCDFDTGGFVALTLFNDALTVDRYGIFPIQAYAQLKNEDWRIAAGLQFAVFNPLNPNMLTFALMAGSGNYGMGFPGQFRVERYWHPAQDTQVTWAVGLSEPVPTTVSNNLNVSEDNGWPTVETRGSIACGPMLGEGPLAKHMFEAGASALIGQIRTTDTTAANRVIATQWGLGTDLRWAITPYFGFQGEVFMGQTLGTYTAGILQNVDAQTFQGIHTAGGWLEAYYYWCPEKLHSHIGYGIDDPLDGDLAPGQPVRNETYFVNLIWDPTKYLRFGCELTYRRTEYTLFRNNEGMGVQTQMQLRF